MPWVGGGRDFRADALLAGAIGLAGVVELVLGAVPEHTWVAVLALLVMTAALAVRRVRPRSCLALVLLAMAGQSVAGVPANAQLVTIPFIVVAAYSVGAHLDRKASAIGLALGVALAAIAIAAGGAGGSDYGFGLMLVTGPWIAGVLVRARTAAEAEAIAGAQVRARQAAEAERERIARELHDIVSHGLSAMVVQASAAAELVDHAPEAARKAMHQVQATGTEAMIEMRHMLGLMRGSDRAGLRPQPALEDVAELVAAEQSAGRAVTLTVKGAPHELPRGLALSVYRIVQESLTNVRKHAAGNRCEVTITYDVGAVEVQVADDGPGALQHRSGPGFGIIGMRERARLYAGTLEAGPRSIDGGWVVRARFPLDHDGAEP
jgi:signal transduction histidine kinase